MSATRGSAVFLVQRSIPGVQARAPEMGLKISLLV